MVPNHTVDHSELDQRRGNVVVFSILRAPVQFRAHPYKPRSLSNVFAGANYACCCYRNGLHDNSDICAGAVSFRQGFDAGNATKRTASRLGVEPGHLRKI